MEDEEERRGWLLTKTPYMAKATSISFRAIGTIIKKECSCSATRKRTTRVFALRPMTCPLPVSGLSQPRPFLRDLPLRYDETSTLFRNEDSGEMHGLIRVRQFTISEGHLMCTLEQLEQEFKSCLELAIYMLKSVGLL